MKKIILILIGILTLYAAYGQGYISGIKVGITNFRPIEYTIDSSSTIDIVPGILDVEGTKMGYAIGCAFRVETSKPLFLQTELYFNNRMIVNGLSSRNQYYYLNVPLHIGLKFKIRKSKIRFQMGVVFSKRLFSSPRNDIDLSPQLSKKIDIGGEISCGFDIRMLNFDFSWKNYSSVGDLNQLLQGERFTFSVSYVFWEKDVD